MLPFALQMMSVKQMLIEKRHACKKFLLVLVHSTVVDTIFDAFLTILVMVPVDAGFLGGLSPSLLSGQPFCCTSHLGLNCQ